MSDTSSSRREATLHEVLEALRASTSETLPLESRCALCILVQRSMTRSLRAFFAEYVNDLEVRVAFRKARGFCPEHTPLLASLGDALAVAILYRDLAEQTEARWQSGARTRRRARWLGGREASGICPACVAAREANRRYAGALAAGLVEESVWEVLEQSAGLCVAHGEQVRDAAQPAHAERLRRLEIERLKTLRAELESFIRKNDYCFRDEPWGMERDAWKRALYKLMRPRDTP
jgi:hypothetical protein